MNPLYLKMAALAFSFRKELFYVTLTFLIVLLIPFVAVIVLTRTGFDVVSDKLAKVDEKTKKIQLYYPNGQKYKEIDANVVWPVTGVITLEFGESDFPYQLFHSGIDIANSSGNIGDPITVAVPGKVIYAGQISWGYGKHIIIDNGDNVTTLYGHLDKIFVSIGDEVKAGKIIGEEGTTGWSTGPHLHFQINVWGIPVNPRTFLGN